MVHGTYIGILLFLLLTIATALQQFPAFGQVIHKSPPAAALKRLKVYSVERKDIS